MFEGKTFLPVTGIPMRKIDCMRSPFAEADPVPLAVAILKAKSFTRSIDYLRVNHDGTTRTTKETRRVSFRRGRHNRRGSSPYTAAGAGMDTVSPASGM